MQESWEIGGQLWKIAVTDFLPTAIDPKLFEVLDKSYPNRMFDPPVEGEGGSRACQLKDDDNTTLRIKPLTPEIAMVMPTNKLPFIRDMVYADRRSMDLRELACTVQFATYVVTLTPHETLSIAVSPNFDKNSIHPQAIHKVQNLGAKICNICFLGPLGMQQFDLAMSPEVWRTWIEMYEKGQTVLSSRAQGCQCSVM